LLGNCNHRSSQGWENKGRGKKKRKKSKEGKAKKKKQKKGEAGLKNTLLKDL